jgi:hypothetical protein
VDILVASHSRRARNQDAELSPSCIGNLSRHPRRCPADTEDLLMLPDDVERKPQKKASERPVCAGVRVLIVRLSGAKVEVTVTTEHLFSLTRYPITISRIILSSVQSP